MISRGNVVKFQDENGRPVVGTVRKYQALWDGRHGVEVERTILEDGRLVPYRYVRALADVQVVPA
jgi:hypothetical protein